MINDQHGCNWMQQGAVVGDAWLGARAATGGAADLTFTHF